MAQTHVQVQVQAHRAEHTLSNSIQGEGKLCNMPFNDLTPGDWQDIVQQHAS